MRKDKTTHFHNCAAVVWKKYSHIISKIYQKRVKKIQLHVVHGTVLSSVVTNHKPIQYPKDVIGLKSFGKHKHLIDFLTSMRTIL